VKERKNERREKERESCSKSDDEKERSIQTYYEKREKRDEERDEREFFFLLLRQRESMSYMLIMKRAMMREERYIDTFIYSYCYMRKPIYYYSVLDRDKKEREALFYERQTRENGESSERGRGEEESREMRGGRQRDERVR